MVPVGAEEAGARKHSVSPLRPLLPPARDLRRALILRAGGAVDPGCPDAADHLRRLCGELPAGEILRADRGERDALPKGAAHPARATFLARGARAGVQAA